MHLDLTTPALLFPAISLLLLAYTNRFLTLATLIRELTVAGPGRTRNRRGQIASLRKRIAIIRTMQILGVLSFFFCVLVMFLLYLGLAVAGEVVFALSLILLMASLGASVHELWLSTHALSLQLDGCEDSTGQDGCRD